MQRRVRDAFDEIAKLEDPGSNKWVKIDAGRSMDDVGEDVWKVVRPILQNDLGEVGKLWRSRSSQQS